jgi:hypothetical protein
LIFKPSGEYSWSKTHAQTPFAYKLDADTIRVFFATRDDQSRSSVSFIDVNSKNPQEVKYVHNEPVLQKGEQGSFDDSGTMPSWFLKHEGKLYLYYTAWNKSQEASYRLSIGLAVSTNDGNSFTKMFKGPVLDRSIYDPIWVGQPCVLIEEGIWKMWYLSCEKIEVIDGHPEPFYNVKYATSYDGVNWNRSNQICIDFEPSHTDAIGRPCIWKHVHMYYMLHSNRLANGYRSDTDSSYRLVLSESRDGIHWSRREDFYLEKDGSDMWDGIMNEYTSVMPTENSGEYFVFYNGNGFGASGFGHLRLSFN